jgi:hypothetical protein
MHNILYQDIVTKLLKVFMIGSPILWWFDFAVVRLSSFTEIFFTQISVRFSHFTSVNVSQF